MDPNENPTYTARQDAKRRAGEARSRAAALAESIGGRVSDYATVKPAEGGYFVDATLWVPDAPEPEPFSAASEHLNARHNDLRAKLRNAEETRDAAQAEATKQTLLKREAEDAARTAREDATAEKTARVALLERLNTAITQLLTPGDFTTPYREGLTHAALTIRRLL